MNNKLTPDIIRKYYREQFPMDEFLSFIGLSDFQNREFGFVLEKDIFIRNISFPTTERLQEFMAENAVKHAYVGAVYEKPPSKQHPIQKNKWKFREFIFDLDIDEYDLVRTCGCSGDSYCSDCWSLIQDAVIFIDETMKEDFGYTNIKWIFSGRRGVHGWILDREPRTFDQKLRVAILNYLTMIHDDKRSQSIEEIPDQAKPLRNRIYSIIAQSFLAKATPKQLQEIGIKQNVRKIIDQAKNSKFFDYNTYNLIIPTSSLIRTKLSKEIILRRFPRIDRKVTMDTRRVSRMPFSIHGKTGKIAIPIKDIHSFYPDYAPTVWDLV